jgi:hypothetical protein
MATSSQPIAMCFSIFEIRVTDCGGFGGGFTLTGSGTTGSRIFVILFRKAMPI